MLVDDPIHQLETHKSYWEDDSTVFVNVAGGDPEHLVNVFRSDHASKRRYKSRSRSRSWWRIIVESPRKSCSGVTSVVVLCYGVLPAPAFTYSATSIMYLKLNEAIIIIGSTQPQLAMNEGRTLMQNMRSLQRKSSFGTFIQIAKKFARHEEQIYVLRNGRKIKIKVK